MDAGQVAEGIHIVAEYVGLHDGNEIVEVIAVAVAGRGGAAVVFVPAGGADGVGITVDQHVRVIGLDPIHDLDGVGHFKSPSLVVDHPAGAAGVGVGGVGDEVLDLLGQFVLRCLGVPRQSPRCRDGQQGVVTTPRQKGVQAGLPVFLSIEPGCRLHQAHQSKRMAPDPLLAGIRRSLGLKGPHNQTDDEHICQNET